MKSRLDAIEDWDALARSTGYCAATLAAKVKACERQLRRYLFERFQVRLHEWLDQLRRDRAIDLLKHGDAPKAIAGILGYKQTNSFYKAFHRWFGVPPLEHLRDLSRVSGRRPRIPPAVFGKR